eukprot:15362741-Ditylum_brightwellii.AAC.1
MDKPTSTEPEIKTITIDMLPKKKPSLALEKLSQWMQAMTVSGDLAVSNTDYSLWIEQQDMT